LLSVLHKDKHTNLLNDFLAFIHQHRLLESNGTTLLAVSGGVDSVVMANLFYRAQLKFAIAHCNFGLRGDASNKDEQFVGQLAQHYQVACYTKNFDTLTYAQQHGLSIQMAARQLRYQWFEELCNQHQLPQIATAHHHNDVLETLLLNLTKGTGIAGLHGILPRKGKLIRPLLFADKSSLLAYAQSENLAWQEDASNAEDTYARNLIRNQVIPILTSINPNLSNTSQLTVERLAQVDLLFQEQLAEIKEEIFFTEGQTYKINPMPIQHKPWATAIIWELLKPFGFNFPQIKQLLSSPLQSGKKIVSTKYQLYVDRQQWMIIPHLPSYPSNYSILNQTCETLQTPHYTLQISIIPREKYQIPSKNQVAALDLTSLEFPLTIRKWQPGDFFYPLGMQKRKKISDFLVDAKVPRPYKEQVEVLVSGNKIAWVIGYRIDERFKIKASTQEVYEIGLLHNSS
jgi:tRNA(Ile)-lysidine synthase